MATRIKTVEYAWQSFSGSLALNTQYIFPTTSVDLPEAAKVFRSARLFFGFKDQITASAATTARVTASIGGVWRVSSSLVNPTPANVMYAPIELDVTSMFSSSFTASVHPIQVAATLTQPATNLTAKLFLTYEYEDSASATLVKTVRFPLQTITGSLTTASQEIRWGVYSTQIPALDTTLPEDNKVYTDIWLETYYSDGLITAMRNTEPSMVMQIGTGSTHQIGFSESTSSAACSGFYIWDQGTTPEWSTAVSQSLNAYFVTTSAAFPTGSPIYPHPAYLLNVTYKYATSSQRVMNSLVLPLPSITHIGGTTEAEAESRDFQWEIQEPGPISSSNSGVLIGWNTEGTNTTRFKFGSGSYIAYTDPGNTRGDTFLSQRIDLDGAWTASRGVNKLPMTVWYGGTSFGGAAAIVAGFAFINYTSNVSTRGEGVHNRSVLHNIRSSSAATSGARTSATRLFVPDQYWYLNALGLVSWANWYQPPASVLWFEAESTGSEGRSGRFEYIGGPGGSTTSTSGYSLTWATEDLIRFNEERWERWANDWTPRFRLNTARRYQFNTHGDSIIPISIWATTHAITYDVTGSVQGSSGGTVELKLFRSEDGTLLSTSSRAGNGTYSLLTYDNTRNVFVTAKESSTLLGRSNDALPSGAP